MIDSCYWNFSSYHSTIDRISYPVAIPMSVASISQSQWSFPRPCVYYSIPPHRVQRLNIVPCHPQEYFFGWRLFLYGTLDENNLYLTVYCTNISFHGSLRPMLVHHIFDKTIQPLYVGAVVVVPVRC